MKQKTKDHVEFGYFFSKDRINTWKNSPLQKLMPDAWGRGGETMGRIHTRRVVVYCCTCLSLCYCQLLEAETMSIFPSPNGTVSCMQTMIN